MQHSLLPLFIAAALPLGGCAYVGLLPAAAEVARSIGQQGYAAEDFGAAANEACWARATRHGRATVTNVQPQSSSIMRVHGTIEDGYRIRNFVCSFRSNGSIASFKMSR